MPLAAVYISTTSFSVTGDQTDLFNVGRQVRLHCGADGYRYGTVTDSTYTYLTVVTISEAVITSNLTAVEVGIVKSGATGSLPAHDHVGDTQGDGGVIPYVPSGGPYYDNTVTVAKSGGQYTSIQSAIDSITDASTTNRYVVLVYPGFYVENIVMKDYVSIKGVAGRLAPRVTGTSGTLLTMPANEAHWSFVDLYMTPTASSDILFDATTGMGSTGQFRIENCHMTMISSAAITPIMIKSNSSFGTFLLDVIATYNISNTATTGSISPILLESGNDRFYMLRTVLNVIVGAQNCLVEAIRDESNNNGRVALEMGNINITNTHASFSNNAICFSIYGGADSLNGAKQMNNMWINMQGGGSGNGAAVYLNSTTNDGEVYCTRNIYNITNYGTNYRYYVGTGDILYSYFNHTIEPLSVDIAVGNLYTTDVDGSGHAISNVAPTSGNHLTNKTYVDGAKPFGNLVTVAKSGGQYTSIQSAIDSITDAASDNVYVVLVYPGDYEENIVMKNYVNIIGTNSRRATKITATSGTLITLPDTEAHINWIDLSMTPTGSSDKVIDATAGSGSTGFYRIENSDISMISSVSGIKPQILVANVGVGLYMINVSANYTMTGTGGTGIFAPFELQSDNALFYYLRSILRAYINSSNASMAAISDNSDGRFYAQIVTFLASFTNASNAGICAPYAVYGQANVDLKQIEAGVISAVGAGLGTGYITYLDSTTNNAVMNISRNVLSTTGFANNRRYYVGAGDTVNSYFNKNDVSLTDNVIGNLYYSDLKSNMDYVISQNMGIKTSSPTAAFDINSDIFRVRVNKTPASASATGNKGDFCWDTGYIYVCTATNTWKRVAIATW